MRRLTIILTLVTLGAAAENLLVNPGFETVADGQPSGWKFFVEPMEGAEATVDPEVALSGDYAARIHNPAPYDKEPANNWSQTINTGLAGEEVLVEGSIKTESATEAALWLQCFREQPWRMLSLTSTGKRFPIAGTQDWTPVSMRVEVPAGTDFVVLRCVLTGKGTAWFDDLTVRNDSKVPPPAKKKPRTKNTRKEKRESEEKTRVNTDSQVAESLLESHRALVETNRALQGMNDALSAQIAELQEEIRGLREEIALLRQASQPEPANKPAPKPVPAPPEPVPPLVPHGYKLEDANGDTP